MTTAVSTNENSIDNHVDDHVDKEIRECFSKENPKCFFVFAGAGSGKTKSLIDALSFLDKEYGNDLLLNGKQIAVITYTNAACDEISRRLQYKPIFSVSTIHSFLWELVKNYQKDIREWITQSVKKDIEELKDKQAKGKPGKTFDKRAEEIQRKTTRLAKFNMVKKFSYNPNGDNAGIDSLSHSEVVKMSTEFIAKEPTMQDILTTKYPILLIDESQDTKKELVDVLLTICEKYKGRFTVGMFGDIMQKIYNDGKDNLADCIPHDWAKPVKKMNHRSAVRIVELANSIRKTVDNQEQKPRSDAEEGIVRLFVVNADANKDATEKKIASIMSEDTNDTGWDDESEYKSLILEHHMAASRFGFSDLYQPLNDSGKFDTALREGSISELSILFSIISPLVEAYQNRDEFQVAKIIRKNSPLVARNAFSTEIEDQTKTLQEADAAVDTLMKLWKDDKDPFCLEVLKTIKETKLFDLGSRVESILSGYVENEDEKVTALRNALLVPFSELERYSAYVTDQTRFATHQGVKGLEFPRVMVIMDDAQARGFLFSYEKLFGAKAKTATDIKNEREGKDTSIMRTARLFYVACTRAQKSLAVVAYTENVKSVKETALSNGWFTESEIYTL